jgi:hypothetical protein
MAVECPFAALVAGAEYDSRTLLDACLPCAKLAIEALHTPQDDDTEALEYDVRRQRYEWLYFCSRRDSIRA